jgi:purine nucleoside permease
MARVALSTAFALLKALYFAAVLGGLGAGANALAQGAPPRAPIVVKVVVVTAFEIGADTGDAPGEFQFWRERQKLDTRFAFPHHHDLFMNLHSGVLGMVTGEGTANAGSAVMELAMDPRFDLSHAYWVVAGIAGIDPADASIGSAVWARHVVDGDLAYEIDAREIPQGWSTGIFPLESHGPYDPKAKPAPGQVFTLNPQLVDWAFALTRNTALGDAEELRSARSHYTPYPNARRPPFVLEGDDIAGMRFWHGGQMNDWANRWVSLWTQGAGNMVTSDMEDSGILVALTYLRGTGRVDANRVLILRTGSNFTLPPPGRTAAANLAMESEASYTALVPALEAAYKVGAAVVGALSKGWNVYRDRLPGAGSAAVAVPVAPSAVTKPIEIKVVVISMFEIGADTGDAPGEFQLWHDRQRLTQRFAFAHHHDLFVNPATGVLGMVTGEGTANSTTAVMELGMDPRFDLTHAYWIVAGIAGVNPDAASLGSAAWARYIVDGDLAYQIDSREIPADWDTGLYPLQSTRPFDPKATPAEGQVFALDPALVQWAYGLTRGVQLPDDAQMRQVRGQYRERNARQPPFVLIGDNLAAMRFWDGRLMNDWAEHWVRFWTHDKGELVTSAMEDSGTLVALTYLGKSARVDSRRVLVLRTGSDFTVPPPGETPAQALAKESENTYAALGPAIEAAYRVGSPVVEALVKNWAVYRDRLPHPAAGTVQ